MKKSYRFHLIILALLVAAGYFLLCNISSEPPVMHINKVATARGGPQEWNYSMYSLVESENLYYGPEHTVTVTSGESLTLRTKKAHWWELRWPVLKGSGSAVFFAAEPVGAQWTGEKSLLAPDIPGEYITELWISYITLSGKSMVRYSFVIHVE